MGNISAKYLNLQHRFSRAFATSQPGKMADDASYMAFLEQANAPLPKSDTAAAESGSTRVQLKTVDPGAKIPHTIEKVLESGDAYYVSDADEEFVGVNLGFEGAERGDWPDEEQFAGLIGFPSPDAVDITILTTTEFDPHNQYEKIIGAVREASSSGAVKVYRVPRGGVRVEYWIVGRAKDGDGIVGLKALAVES